MNERIRELAEQAGFQWSKFGLVATPDSDAEKFAELLIRECANIVESSSLPDAYSEACLLNIADEIKEHFGVEE
jgi:hypothetical protein